MYTYSSFFFFSLLCLFCSYCRTRFENSVSRHDVCKFFEIGLTFLFLMQVKSGVSLKFLCQVKRELLRLEPKASQLTTDDVVNMCVFCAARSRSIQCVNVNLYGILRSKHVRDSALIPGS